MSIYDNLLQDLRDIITDEFDALVDDDYPQDRLTEIVDGMIPVYNYELANLLAEDTSFAQVEDSGLLPENPDVWTIIKIALYERLSAEAYETYYELLEQNDDER